MEMLTTMIRLPLGASAAGLALFIISGCATCGPRTCPVADAAIQQLQEVTTELETRYVQGENSPLSLEEAMDANLPIELGGGGVVRSDIRGSTADYILEFAGGTVATGYDLASDPRRTPQITFGYTSEWGFDSCYWSAKDPKWRCRRT